jgi:branched-chain amino acid transport system substrate-binding protein
MSGRSGRGVGAGAAASRRRRGRAALLAALLLPAGGARAAPVKLGFINSITGPEAPIGESLTNGVKLAEEDLRAAGIDVQIVTEDDTGKPAIGLSALEKLATRDEVAGWWAPTPRR